MISEKLKLDDIDRRIITLVQEDPNLTHTQIAEKINRSQPTVGMRIKKLEKEGILQFQPGVNFKRIDLFLSAVTLNTKRPNETLDMAKFCPFMLNAFRLSGSHNIMILLASSKLEKLDNIVNYHFRSDPSVQSVSMNMYFLPDACAAFSSSSPSWGLLAAMYWHRTCLPLFKAAIPCWP